MTAKLFFLILQENVVINLLHAFGKLPGGFPHFGRLRQRLRRPRVAEALAEAHGARKTQYGKDLAPEIWSKSSYFFTWRFLFGVFTIFR